MRLLERDDTGEFRLAKAFPNDVISKILPYAILSHTWGDEEVLFKDLADGTAKNKASYAKIRFCGNQAERDGLKFFWVDTCCIDKSDSAELQEALNSMFQWYRNAAKCYVYLADVSTRHQDTNGGSDWKPAFQQSRWFTRGWTLQEVIAPTSVEFFSREGVRLGDKESLKQEIHDITGIPLKALQGKPLSDFSIADRLAWMKKRDTKYEEDRVYCLFGIFGVHIPVLYGEGKQKALKRLRDKIHEDYLCLARLWSADPRDPRVDKERIEGDKGGLLVDAYRWVLDNPDFKQWRYLPESRLLWIKGDPGKGKTMLLCGIINELERPILTDGGNLAYFFCQATDTRINNATAVLRGLIYLLAHRQPRLLLHLPENTYPSDDAMAWVVLSNVLGKMLDDPNLKATYLVIDALDECVTGLSRFLELVARTSATSSRVKWVVSSRNWPQIEEQLAAIAQQSRLSLELNAKSVTTAVEAFIRHKVLYLSQLKRYDSAIENSIHDYLSSNADGTFLWVALVCQALAHPNVRKWQILTKLHTFPPGLDSLYTRMIEQITASDCANLCKQILAVVTIVRRPISLQEINTLVEMPHGISDDPESLAEVIGLCGSFLTLREQTIYFVHQSVKDFLLGKATHETSREAFTWIFPQGTQAVNYNIFSRSLCAMPSVLKRDMYSLSAPGFPIDRIRVPKPDPLAGVWYSCIYWVDHLFDAYASNAVICTRDLQDGSTVHSFLRENYLYWLEALSLARDMPKGVLAIEKLHSLVQSTKEPQLNNMVRDMWRFILTHRFAIESAPLQAYTSALIFSPTRSLTRQLFQKDEPKWFVNKSIKEEDWNSCLTTLEGHSGAVSSVAFSSNGRQLASASYDNTVKLWDAATGACLTTFEGHSRIVSSVAFSPKDQQLASASYDTTVNLWDTMTGVCVMTFEGHYDAVSSVAFSSNGQQLASASYDKTVKLWDIMTGTCLTTLKGHSHAVSLIVFSTNGQQLASTSYDNTIKLWDAMSSICLITFKGHSHAVSSAAFSPNGQQLASASYDNTVKLWNVMTGACLMTFKEHSNTVSSVAFSPNGQQLASASHDKTIKLWNITTGVCLTTFEEYSHAVSSITFSPNGQRLASTSYDKTIKLWDITTDAYRTAFKGHNGAVRSVTFSPNGQQLASASNDNTIKLWDVMTNVCLTTFKGHSDTINLVTFSSNGQQLASVSYDKTIKLWDATKGTCLTTFEGHIYAVKSVAFSSNDQQLVSASDDRTVKLWDITTGACLTTFEGHSNIISSVAFSPNGQQLASASHDKTIKLWDVTTRACIQTISVGKICYKISFNSTGTCLDTDLGFINLARVSTRTNYGSRNVRDRGYGVNNDLVWITHHTKNLLWLPSEYRPSSSAVKDSIIGIGCTSGRIWFLRFSMDITPTT